MKTTVFEAPSVEISVDARRIKHLRQRVGLSGRALAALVKIDPAGLSRWSTGQRMPSVLMLTRLCRVLGVAYFDIVTVTDLNPAPGSQDAPQRSRKPLSGTSGQSTSPTTTGKAGSSPATA